MTLAITITYLLSVYGAYKFVQKSYYHKKGRWSNLSPEKIDTTMIFIPGVNTIATIDCITGGWKHYKYKKTNFFKPKNNVE